MSTDIPKPTRPADEKPARPSAATIKKATMKHSEKIFEVIGILESIRKDCPTLVSVQTNLSNALLHLKPARFLLERDDR